MLRRKEHFTAETGRHLKRTKQSTGTLSSALFTVRITINDSLWKAENKQLQTTTRTLQQLVNKTDKQQTND